MAAALSSAAFAGAGTITTNVQPLSDAVTYSRVATGSLPALDMYIGYTVSVASAATTTNTINNVVFTGTLTVTDGDEVAAYVSADGATCQVIANPLGSAANARTISCAIGQLRAGEAFPTFAVFFKSPVKDLTVPVTPDGTSGQCQAKDCASFRGVTYYAEGTGGIGSPPANSTSCWPGPCPSPTEPSLTAVEVTLGTTNLTLVKSGVQKTGGTLFTGSGAAAKPEDTWTTTVVIPGGFEGATYTTAEINETEKQPPLAGNLLTGSVSKLTIPGTFPKLVITLRRDASTIGPGAKIANARIYYNTNADGPVGNEVLPCSNTDYGALPQVGIPCIKTRTEYKRNNSPDPKDDWVGDWEFVIWALDNGKYEQ